jgi:hypothetical protein
MPESSLKMTTIKASLLKMATKKAGLSPAWCAPEQDGSAPLCVRIDVRACFVDLAAQVAAFVRRQAPAAASAVAIRVALLHLDSPALLFVRALLLTLLIAHLLIPALLARLFDLRGRHAFGAGAWRRRQLGVVAAAMVLCLGRADTGTGEHDHSDTMARQAGEPALGQGCCIGTVERICHGVPLPWCWING